MGRNPVEADTIRRPEPRARHVDGGAPTGSGPWPAIDCVGFVTLIQRGAEWTATGAVTQAVPATFPTAGGVSLRSESAP